MQSDVNAYAGFGTGSGVSKLLLFFKMPFLGFLSKFSIAATLVYGWDTPVSSG